MKKPLCILLGTILLLTTRVFAQSAGQDLLLEKAYKQKSSWLLELFFQNWTDEVQPRDTVGLNAYTTEAYRLFSVFYQPLDLTRYPHMDRWDESYQEPSWFIVQGQLHYVYVTDHIYFTQQEFDSVTIEYVHQNVPEEKWSYYLERDAEGRFLHHIRVPKLSDPPKQIIDSALDFRPPVSFAGKGIVYLTSGYKKLLDEFLKAEHIIDMDNHVVYPSPSERESEERMNFFSQSALIHVGHWGGYWQYETYPQAYSITFDKAMQRASIDYILRYEGGTAIFEKQNGEWKFVKITSRWIE